MYNIVHQILSKQTKTIITYIYVQTVVEVIIIIKGSELKTCWRKKYYQGKTTGRFPEHTLTAHILIYTYYVGVF